jgi:hypothetical protein
MTKKIKLRDKTVLHIVDQYVVDRWDWRVFYAEMGEVLESLRGVK